MIANPVQPQTDMFPSYWFVKLEEAISDGDFDLASEAAKQLKKFGIVVRYPRPLFSDPEPEAAVS